LCSSDLAHLGLHERSIVDTKQRITMTAPDKYGVVGNPIAHSRSPEIHQRFARQSRERIAYERIEVPLDAFEERALALRDAGFRGLNVTVPFKIDAAKLADDLMPRARLAGAVN